MTASTLTAVTIRTVRGLRRGGRMRVSPQLVVIVLCLSSASIASAQHAPLCDVTCGPDPTSPTYGGTFGARPLSHNVRGQGTALAARAEGGHKRAPTIAGSQSAF